MCVCVCVPPLSHQGPLHGAFVHESSEKSEERVGHFPLRDESLQPVYRLLLRRQRLVRLPPPPQAVRDVVVDHRHDTHTREVQQDETRRPGAGTGGEI